MTIPNRVIGIVAAVAVALLLLGGLAWFVDWAEVIVYGAPLPTFLAQVAIAILFALVLEWLIKLVTSLRWYDLRGAAREMWLIEARVGTERELSGDNVACAIKLAAWVLYRVAFIALWLDYLQGAAPPT